MTALGYIITIDLWIAKGNFLCTEAKCHIKI